MAKRKFNAGRNYWRQGGSARKRRRTTFSRVPRFGRVSRKQNNVHHFKRTWVASDTLPFQASGAYGKGLYFTFGAMDNSTEFTTLFDQYRMNKILVKLVPNFTGADVNPSTTVVTLPNVHTVIDYDSAADPATLSDLLQYNTYRMHRGGRMITRKWTPGMLLDGDSAGTATASVLKFKEWVDMAYTNVRFYGLRSWIEAAGATITSAKYQIYVTYYFSCKGLR